MEEKGKIVSTVESLLCVKTNVDKPIVELPLTQLLQAA